MSCGGCGAPGNGIFAPSVGTLAFSANDAERMRISDTGYVGIGTADPQALLHVVAAQLQGLNMDYLVD